MRFNGESWNLSRMRRANTMCGLEKNSSSANTSLVQHPINVTQEITYLHHAGTVFTNHFAVLEKTPTCLTMRGCFGPRQDPIVPQNVDNLFELRAELDEQRKVVKLKLRCLTFDGTEGAKEDPDPFGGVAGFLHRRYSSLLVESGAGNCLR